VGGRAGSTNLTEVFDYRYGGTYITDTLDAGTNLDLVFLDFATKAFDKVPRRRILDLMAGYPVGYGTRHLKQQDIWPDIVPIL
jgi:hypothetical protein